MTMVRGAALGAFLLMGLLMGGCASGGGADSVGADNPARVTGARALSTHYVEVMLSAPVDGDAESTRLFRIVAADGTELAVREVRRTSRGDRLVLETDAQRAVPYSLAISAVNGSLGQDGTSFTGSSQPEPRLVNAVSLSSTSVLLTFDAKMNKLTAEMPQLYRVSATAGAPETDVRVTAATLGVDEITVELTTTPQANVAYTVAASNLEAKFQPVLGCNGELVNYEFTDNAQCSSRLHPFTRDGIPSSIVLTSRNGVLAAVTEPEGKGSAGSVYPIPAGGGAGVKSSTCTSQESAYVDGDGPPYYGDEELTLDLDTPVQNEAILLKLVDLSLATDSPVIFLSSAGSAGFDFTFAKAAVSAATLQVSSRDSYIQFAELGLPPGTLIDRVRLRETTGNWALGSACLTSRVLIDPTQDSADFLGTPPVDDVQPQITGAVALNASTVLVSFSEPVGAAAANPTNYTFLPELTVTGAQLNAYGTQVKLTTLPMTVGWEYTVTGAPAIVDVATPPNPLDEDNDSAPFTFSGGGSSDDSPRVLPRVLGAASTGNTTVLVSFSKAMSDSVLDPAAYFVTQENVNPEAGYLAVIGAEFLGTSRKTVILTTRAQSEVRYRVTVVNVEDLQGNSIAPKELLVDPATAVFPGTPGEAVDSDGDGLSDAEEQRGWAVTVTLTGNGGPNADPEVLRRQVTSDPLVADTDGDGLDDATEKVLGTSPRDSDTDDDLIPDAVEDSRYFSNPRDQDSDDDGVDDFLEITLFRTSPIMADTDGDQFEDAIELFELNRDPLVADLPSLRFDVDDYSLDLEISSSFTDEQGEKTSIEDSASATFTQSRANTVARSDTATIQTDYEFSQEFGFEVGGDLLKLGSWKVSGKVGAKQSVARGQTTSVNVQEALTSQDQYQSSVKNASEQSERRSVTRETKSASIKASLTISNLFDLALQVSNVEISLLQQDNWTGSAFRPIATLRPTGQATFNLGPNESDRGPIIFESNAVFPNRVDDLMREPSGLIFEVVNFDVLDEAGRNLVFTWQDVVARTAGVTIDFGDGRVESYKVATASEFNEKGEPVGITVQEALEIVGIFEAGSPGTDDSNTYETEEVQVSDDVGTLAFQRLARIRDRRNSADGKGAWRSVISRGDVDERSDFGAVRLRGRDSILLFFGWDRDEDGLTHYEEYRLGTSDEDADSDGDGLTDAFEARVGWTVAKLPGAPYQVFSSPARPDSDMDGLGDAEEESLGTDPNRWDTDEDGFSDHWERYKAYEIEVFDLRLNDYVLAARVQPYRDEVIDAGPNGVCETSVQGDDEDVVGEDEDGDDPDAPKFRLCVGSGDNGVIDSLPVAGDDVLRFAHDGLFGTDPLRFDSDFDGIGDGREEALGINPNSSDADNVTDTDGDGLFDYQEDAGWSTPDGAQVDSDKNRPDTDRDGLPDVIEWAIASDPRRPDTDGDGLLDYEEFDPADDVGIYDSLALLTGLQRCAAAPRCAYVPPASNRTIGTHPGKKDTDGDGRADNVERSESWTVSLYGGTPRTVSSDPRYADRDLDGLNDFEELRSGTDPGRSDTDGDGRLDGREVLLGLDPLRRDVRLSVKLASITVTGDCDPEAGRDGMELHGGAELRVLAGGATYYFYTSTNERYQGFSECQLEKIDCTEQNCCTIDRPCSGDTVPVGHGTRKFILKEGDWLSLRSGPFYDEDSATCGFNPDAADYDDPIGRVEKDIEFSRLLSELAPEVVVQSSSGPSCEIVLNYRIAIDETSRARFVDNGDGTITDRERGLMWEKKTDDGSIHDKDNYYNYADAISQFIAELNAGDGFAGYKDWYLPAIGELESLQADEAYPCGFAPCIFEIFHQNCEPGCTTATCSCTATGPIGNSVSSLPYASSQDYQPNFNYAHGFDYGLSVPWAKNLFFNVRAARPIGPP